MKKLFFISFFIVIGLAVVNNYAQEEPKKEVKQEQTETQQSEMTTEKGEPVNSMCLVSGEEVDPEITVEYEGKTYAFCCNNCLKKFNKDPEKYIKRYEQMQKSSEEGSE
ncbi:MAG: hypothetical protein Kow0098_18520 [Ignavibacteriaceae bacterium]